MNKEKTPATPMTAIASTLVTTTTVSTIPKFGVDSPEMIALCVKACKFDDQAHEAWLNLAKALYSNDVRAIMLELSTKTAPNKEYDLNLVKKLFGYCVQYLTPSEQKIIQADRTSLDSDQNKLKTTLTDKINAKMQKIRNHLKILDDKALGVNKIIPFGDKLSDKVQEVIDDIQKAKSERINFRMVESLTLLRMAKNALKNMPNPEYQAIQNADKLIK
jgi:hypothetical protein